MKKRLCLTAALLLSSAIHAYNAPELLADCRAAELLALDNKNNDPEQMQKAARCRSYVSGFTDGYGLSERLAGKIGVRIGAFCLPDDPEILARVVRAVVIHVERVPPDTTVPPATLVAGALAKTFPCSD